ncbi:hypothetical protein TNIN_216551 [Trichonephila inaurata madagascariensis]|uniref:Uncharacterized protein n=1 Tax=Trichonephila inaurata madagascariensis TaxID=2747483 RepID=A0A8X6MB22_9ARAC|nr:hypothetical protein TNIN_216551 [Trichonephila inaurata madagascariensis]
MDDRTRSKPDAAAVVQNPLVHRSPVGRGCTLNQWGKKSSGKRCLLGPPGLGGEFSQHLLFKHLANYKKENLPRGNKYGRLLGNVHKKAK